MKEASFLSGGEVDGITNPSLGTDPGEAIAGRESASCEVGGVLVLSISIVLVVPTVEWLHDISGCRLPPLASVLKLLIESPRCRVSSRMAPRGEGTVRRCSSKMSAGGGRLMLNGNSVPLETVLDSPISGETIGDKEELDDDSRDGPRGLLSISNPCK